MLVLLLSVCSPSLAANDWPVYYNVDQGTAGEGGTPRQPWPPIQVDVTQYRIKPLNYTQAERACILDGCEPWTSGAFPLLECSRVDGRVIGVVNGGVPQRANLSYHLNLIRQTLPKWIPEPTWSGNAVIDFEAWTTVWHEMDKHADGACYQNYSRALVREEHPTWGAAQVEAAAEGDWETAATSFFRETLRTCAEVRPNAKWGFYGLPSRGHSGGTADSPPWSEYSAKQLPIFEVAGAMYPSIYMTDGSTAEHVSTVHSIVNETKALAAHVERARGSRPLVLPFAWEFCALSWQLQPRIHLPLRSVAAAAASFDS